MFSQTYADVVTLTQTIEAIEKAELDAEVAAIEEAYKEAERAAKEQAELDAEVAAIEEAYKEAERAAKEQAELDAEVPDEIKQCTNTTVKKRKITDKRAVNSVTVNQLSAKAEDCDIIVINSDDDQAVVNQSVADPDLELALRLSLEVQEALEKQKALNRERDAKITKQLRELGLKVVSVKRDGNCLFYALIYCLKQISEMAGTDTTCITAAGLREILVDFLEYNKDVVSCRNSPETVESLCLSELDMLPDFERYIADMRKNGFWGGMTVVNAFAECFNCSVKVWMTPRNDNGGSDVVYEEYFGFSYKERNHTVHLWYNGVNHFNAMEPEGFIN